MCWASFVLTSVFSECLNMAWLLKSLTTDMPGLGFVSCCSLHCLLNQMWWHKIPETSNLSVHSRYDTTMRKKQSQSEGHVGGVNCVCNEMRLQWFNFIKCTYYMSNTILWSLQFMSFILFFKSEVKYPLPHFLNNIFIDNHLNINRKIKQTTSILKQVNNQTENLLNKCDVYC